MPIVTFSELRGNLKKIMDLSADRHEAVVVKQSRGENMVLLSQRDYESLAETAYLLGNETNAKWLRKSMQSLRSKPVIKKNPIKD